MFSSILFISILVLIAIAAIIGFVRGTKKSIIRAITIVLAIAITIIFGSSLASLVGSAKVIIDGNRMTLNEYISNAITSNETVASIVEDSPILLDAVEKIPVLICAVIGTIGVFIALRLAGLIIYLIIALVLRIGKKRATTFLSRIGGMLIHALCAILSIAMVFMPVLGLTSVTNKDEVTIVAGAFSDDSEGIDNIGNMIYNTPVVNIMSLLGVKKLGVTYLNGIAYITNSNGEKIGLLTELDELIDVIVKAEEQGIVSSATSGETEKIFTALEHYDFTYALCLELLDSNIVKESLPSIISTLIKTYADEQGIPSVIANPAIDGIKVSLQKAFTESNDKEGTAAALATILSGVGAFANIANSADSFSASNIIETVGVILGSLQANTNLSAFGVNLMDLVINTPGLETYSPIISTIKGYIESGTDIKELTKVVGASMELMDIVNSNLGTELTVEKAEDTIKKIIVSLDDNIATEIKKVVSVDTIKNFVTDESYVGQIVDVIDVVIDELVNASDKENYAQEAEAITTIMSTVINGDNTFTVDDIATLYNTAANSTIVKNTLKAVEQKNVLSIDSNAMGVADTFATAINELYSRSDKTNDDVWILESIASILNISDKVNLK